MSNFKWGKNDRRKRKRERERSTTNDEITRKWSQKYESQKKEEKRNKPIEKETAVVNIKYKESEIDSTI